MKHPGMSLPNGFLLLGLLWCVGRLAGAAPLPAGRAVYEQACAHCHGQDGSGWREKNGPTLRQTAWVTGDPDRLIRITLGGLYLRIPLEGGTHYGSMPGVVRTLDDQQVADVLTYIRQDWGNRASAIAPTRVAALRPEALSRSLPWTARDFGLEVQPRLGANGEALAPPDPFAAEGFKIYAAVCQNCHQPDGRGIVTQDGHGYPPLRDSEFVNGTPERLIRIVLGGLQGEIVVKGQRFTEVMPAWHVALNDDQVAQVLTFVRQAWSNLAPPVRPGQVQQLRAESAARGGVPWTLPDLQSAEAKP